MKNFLLSSFIALAFMSSCAASVEIEDAATVNGLFLMPPRVFAVPLPFVAAPAFPLPAIAAPGRLREKEVAKNKIFVQKIRFLNHVDPSCFNLHWEMRIAYHNDGSRIFSRQEILSEVMSILSIIDQNQNHFIRDLENKVRVWQRNLDESRQEMDTHDILLRQQGLNEFKNNIKECKAIYQLTRKRLIHSLLEGR